MGVLLFWLSVVVALTYSTPTAPPSNAVWSVYRNGESWALSQGKVMNNIAFAQLQTNYNTTGWASLEIVTNGVSQDNEQAYGAGYIEGALTTDMIYNSWITNLQYYWNGDFPPSAAAWLKKNDEWVREQVLECSLHIENSNKYAINDCSYWYQVGLVLSQLDGMVLGYNEHCSSNQRLPYEVFLYMSANNDVGDVLTALNVTQVPENPWQAMLHDHCSVLVKYSEQDQQLYHAHVTWGDYINMLRVFKHYTLNYNDASTMAKTISFSGFPGVLTSGDDYFITDQGLIVTETTNDIFNSSLYENVQTNTVLYWLRVIVSNRVSDSGKAWVETFAKYNSGTYNNQWQVTDTKLFKAGQAFVAGTLWVLEQVPGYVVSEDLTSFLTNYGHFPSYNIPYFPFIYNISGYPAQYAAYGDAFSYSACPRANIFRRDQANVVTFEDMQNIMRYNDYQNDPFSLGDPCNGISARCDLDTSTNSAWGAYDCKATSTSLIGTMTTTAVSGPTTLDEPPFSWTGRFASFPRYGQPTTFNFTFETMQPTLTL